MIATARPEPMGPRSEWSEKIRAGHATWLLVCAVGWAAPATVDSAPVPPASPSSVVPGVPLFAKVEGDATDVGLAWWAVKGAAQYEVRRAADPQGTASVRSTLPAGTLGYRDTLPANPAAWFQLVAIGADGARSASAWMLVNTPSIGGINSGPTGTLIRWTTIQPASAGFEIWRSADPRQPASRVGSVATGTTTFTDPKPLAGASYYQVVALGGGARAASAWTAAAAAPAGSSGAVAAAPSTGSPVPAALSACGCPGPQSPPGPPGPAGPPGSATPPKDLLQQIATLQTQIDALKAVLAVDAAHSVTLTAGRDLQEQVGGSESISVDLDRTTHVARDDSLTVGGNSVTSVGKSWQVTGGQDVQLSAATGITLQAKSARYALSASEGSAYLPGNWIETVDRDRTAKVGRNDTLSIGMGAFTSVGTNWDLTAAQAVAVKAGKQITLSSGEASVRFNPDSSIAISGTKLSISAAGDLQLVSGGTLTLNGAKLTVSSAGATAGVGTTARPAPGGTGAPCTLGDVTLTAGGIGNGTPADGRVLTITSNVALFSVLGNNYGGDGQTTFALPDLRAVAPNGLTYLICTQGVFPQRL